ncbi:hemolymph protein-like protein [Culex quinquefasciatus]|uniref:Hemolymph protein-like protein n=1 Tax=Culex quinquefasciatus TaxID=7176 RepID=B0WT40_CULQU|nr:hemolymph protein-like protein [Culex quinquefasciatus]|eukprot:XP_001870801.1 hemolymph protein-like protein [Culex quinquefasciatus]
MIVAIAVLSSRGLTTPKSSAIPIFHGYYLSALQEGCHSKTNESTIRPSGVAQFRSCIAKHLDLQETQREYAQLNDFSRIQFFDKYCPQINSSLECFGPMMEDLRRCRDPEDMKLYEVVAETLPKAVSWICLNHGEVFAKLKDPRTQMCLDSLESKAEVKCGRGMSSVFKPRRRRISQYEEVECRGFIETHNCIVEKYISCGVAEAKELLDLFYKPIMEATSKAAVLPEKTQNSSSSLSLGDSLDISVPFVGDLEGACLARTGSNDTFEEIISTVYMVPLCFALNLEVDRLMADAQDLAEASGTTRVEFFKR